MLQNKASPNSSPNQEYRALQQYILTKMIQEDAQSKDGIIKQIASERGVPLDKNNKAYKAIQTSVLRAFRNLMLPDKDDRRRIASIHKNQVSGNQWRHWYTLTDDGIDWYVEKFGISRENLWFFCINILEKNYSYRFANHKGKRIEYDLKSSKLIKWNVDEIFNEYWKKFNISKILISPFGYTRLLEILRYVNESFVWMIDDKNYKKLAISMLENYAFRRQDQIDKFREKVDHDINPEDQTWTNLLGERLIYYYRVNNESEEKISIFGILFLISNLSNDNKIEEIISKNRDELPLVFDEKIWPEIKNLITRTFSFKNRLSKTLTDVFTMGFSEVFDNSLYWEKMSNLNLLYNLDYGLYPEFEKVYKAGSLVFYKITHPNKSPNFLNEYLISNDPLPEFLKKYKKIFNELKKLYRIDERSNRDFYDWPNIDDDQDNLLRKPIQDEITFHIYTYLYSIVKKEDWDNFIKKNPTVREFWNEWCQEIAKFSTMKNIQERFHTSILN